MSSSSLPKNPLFESLLEQSHKMEVVSGKTYLRNLIGKEVCHLCKKVQQKSRFSENHLAFIKQHSLVGILGHHQHLTAVV